ncbi:GDF9 factor, partial [Dicaeum eximium]|nr:GDF9 factor [Dicaeum eximium]
MEGTWRICVCLYCCLPWLSPGTQCSPRSGGRGGSGGVPGFVAAPGDAGSSLRAAEVLRLPQASPAPLPALLRVLQERGARGWQGEAPRPQPDSRALRYMKRLYRMSATSEGIPKARRGRLYNTVRLFTPCGECGHSRGHPGTGDVHSVDLLFNLDRVTALEHLLKSVLLYSFDTSVPTSSSITCICHLSLKEHDFSSQVCSSISHSLAFSLHFDVRKRKWVEMDVTSFLQPLIATNRRNVHMALNFTCLMGDPQGSTKQENTINVTLVPPSLLLYLNDTSEQAYHRGSSPGHGRKSSSPPADPPQGDRGQGAPRGTRASRQRRSDNPKAAPGASAGELLQELAVPQHECELHTFRLSFSQLRWDRWIIAPHRYSPQFCRGDCPRALGHRYGSPVHTMVQTLIYERLDPSVPRPSCVPAAYSPLSVLTIEPDGSIAYKEYEDMIATRCTCR